MNFLLRSASSATHRPPVSEPPPATPPPEATKPESTLEGLISEEPFPQYPSVDEDHLGDGSRDDHGNGEANANTGGFGMERFSDVSEYEGWISIPYSMTSHFEPSSSLLNLMCWLSLFYYRGDSG